MEVVINRGPGHRSYIYPGQVVVATTDRGTDNIYINMGDGNLYLIDFQGVKKSGYRSTDSMLNVRPVRKLAVEV